MCSDIHLEFGKWPKAIDINAIDADHLLDDAKANRLVWISACGDREQATRSRTEYN